MGKSFFTASLIVLSSACLFGDTAPDQDFNNPHAVISVTKPSAIPVQASRQSQAAQAASAELVREVTPAQRPITKSEAIMAAGDKYLNVRNFAMAVKYYYYATKLNAGDIKAWKKTAFCYYQLKKHNYAYYAFQMVLKKDPNDKDALDFMDYYKTIIGNSKKKFEKREMFDPLWRSVIFPGWGQFYNKQYAKGALYGAAFLCSLGLTFYNVADEKTKYSKYVVANENQEIAFKEAQDAWNYALIWGIIAGVAYAANIYDAGVNYDSDEAKGLSLNIKQDAVYLTASMKW
jgi:tetratricopeptide (TPR) repeat protein